MSLISIILEIISWYDTVIDGVEEMNGYFTNTYNGIASLETKCAHLHTFGIKNATFPIVGLIDHTGLRCGNKTRLWESLIRSATSGFTTKEGHELVQDLYENHKTEFGSALHIIEKSLKNIKEESNWSNENLPVIEKWLDSFLAKNL